jgi:hypothetical protein
LHQVIRFGRASGFCPEQRQSGVEKIQGEQENRLVHIGLSRRNTLHRVVLSFFVVGLLLLKFDSCDCSRNCRKKSGWLRGSSLNW